MTLTFIGADHEVTGSCYLLEACGKKILIDCGLEQGADIYASGEIPVPAGDIDCVLLTHAHIDHSGKLPLLAAQGFSGPIYCTRATQDLCATMLKDSAHIQEFEAEGKSRMAKRAGRDPVNPLYTVDDAVAALRLFRGCSYQEMLSL